MVTTTIFESGQHCGSQYLIERLCARSPVGESYLAKDTATGQSVVVTCSRLNHSEPARQRQADFLSKASRLKNIKDGNTAQVLAADVTDGGVYWVARENVIDVVPLAQIFAPTTSSAMLQGMANGLTAGKPTAYVSLLVTVGYLVADLLGDYSNAGFHHGGLDPSAIALRVDMEPIVFEIGYCELFGDDHPCSSPIFEQCRAPERIGGAGPDVRSDVFSFGVIFAEIIERGIREYKLPPMRIQQVLEPLFHRDPRERPQRWEDVAILFETGVEQLQGNLPEGAKARLGLSPPTPEAQRAAPRSGTRPKAAEDGADTDPSPPPVVEAAAPTPRLPVIASTRAALPVAIDVVPAPRPNVADPELSPAPLEIDVDLNGLAADEPAPRPHAVGETRSRWPRPARLRRRGAPWGALVLGSAVLVAGIFVESILRPTPLLHAVSAIRAPAVIELPIHAEQRPEPDEAHVKPIVARPPRPALEGPGRRAPTDRTWGPVCQNFLECRRKRPAVRIANANE